MMAPSKVMPAGLAVRRRKRTLPTEHEGSPNERKESERLEQAREVLRCAAPGYSAPLQKREEDRHSRRDCHGFAVECREKCAGKFTDDQRNSRRGTTS